MSPHQAGLRHLTAQSGGRALPLIALYPTDALESPLTHRDTATHLARHGFVVLLPEHVGNSRSDTSLDGTIERLRVRPQQVHDAFAALQHDDELGAHVDPHWRAIVGHSIGACTALAAEETLPGWLASNGVWHLSDAA